MKRFVIIIRGPVAGISGKNSLATDAELAVIRTWLIGLKERYADMLYQKFSGQSLYLSSQGKIEQKIVHLLDGGEISQVITLILSSWEEANEIAVSFPFPNTFYSIELREMA